jgi:hypothetical protein
MKVITGTGINKKEEKRKKRAAQRAGLRRRSGDPAIRSLIRMPDER